MQIPESIHSRNDSAVILPIFFFYSTYMLGQCTTMENCTNLYDLFGTSMTRNMKVMPSNKEELIACAIGGLCQSSKRQMRTHVWIAFLFDPSPMFCQIGTERPREWRPSSALSLTSRSLILFWNTQSPLRCLMNSFVTTGITRCNCLSTCERQGINGTSWITPLRWIFCIISTALNVKVIA